MTDPKALIERLPPCPFCDGELDALMDAGGTIWRHPLIPDCILQNCAFGADDVAAWNRRAPFKPDEATVERVAADVHAAFGKHSMCFRSDACSMLPCSCATHIARAALSALPRAEAEGWRTIESAVKDGSTEILAFDGHSVVVAAYWRKADGWWPLFSNPKTGFQVHPTHWMPLPTPPAAPKEGSR